MFHIFKWPAEALPSPVKKLSKFNIYWVEVCTSADLGYKRGKWIRSSPLSCSVFNIVIIKSSLSSLFNITILCLSSPELRARSGLLHLGNHSHTTTQSLDPYLLEHIHHHQHIHTAYRPPSSWPFSSSPSTRTNHLHTTTQSLDLHLLETCHHLHQHQQFIFTITLVFSKFISQPVLFHEHSCVYQRLYYLEAC